MTPVVSRWEEDDRGLMGKNGVWTRAAVRDKIRWLIVESGASGKSNQASVITRKIEVSNSSAT